MKVSEKILQQDPAPTPLNVWREKQQHSSNSLVAGNFVGTVTFVKGSFTLKFEQRSLEKMCRQDWHGHLSGEGG